MAQGPDDPDVPASGTGEPSSPEQPVSLDLTSNDSPASVAPNVQSAIEEFANRSGLSVAEVKKKATVGASEQTGDQGSDKGAAYAPRDRAQDSARQIITLWLIGLFCVLITLAFAALFMVGLKSGFNNNFFEKLKSLLDVLLGPVITLLSSAIGFYFGYQQGAGTLGAPKNNVNQKPGNNR